MKLWLFYILNVSINPIINLQGWYTFQIALLATSRITRAKKELIIEAITD